MARKHISYPEELDDAIEALKEAGVVDSHSEMFQRSAYVYLGVIQTAVESLDVDDEEDLAEVLEAIRGDDGYAG